MEWGICSGGAVESCRVCGRLALRRVKYGQRQRAMTNTATLATFPTVHIDGLRVVAQKAICHNIFNSYSYISLGII